MKVMSDSPWLVDFALGLVDCVLYLPDGQVKVLGEISNGHIEFQFKSYSIQVKTCKQKSWAS